jgi:hypothetical protein
MNDQPDGGTPKFDWSNAIGLVLAGGLVGMVAGHVLFSQPGQLVWDAQAQVLAIFAVSAILGSLVTTTLFWMRGKQAEASWFYVPLFCMVIMTIAAARADQMSFVQASLIIVFGSVALSAAAAALSSFRKGEAIELQSNWGGLGGGLGGWRLSSATSLAVLAFLFAGGAAVVVQPRNPAPAEVKAGSDTSDTKGNKGAKAGAVAQPLGRAAPPSAATPPPAGGTPPQGQRIQ